MQEVEAAFRKYGFEYRKAERPYGLPIKAALTRVNIGDKTYELDLASPLTRQGVDGAIHDYLLRHAANELRIHAMSIPSRSTTSPGSVSITAESSSGVSARRLARCTTPARREKRGASIGIDAPSTAVTIRSGKFQRRAGSAVIALSDSPQQT